MSWKYIEKIEDVIPSWLYRGTLPIKDVNTLAELGKGNIEEIIRIHSRMLSDTLSEIEKRKNYYEFIKGKSGKDIERLSQEYDNPTFSSSFIKYYMREDTIGKDYEPAKREDARKRGSTNFNKCGWCEFSDGPRRYDCVLWGDCKLLSGTGLFGEKKLGRKIRFYYDCLLKELDRKDFEKIEEAYKRILDELEKKRIKEKGIIEELKKLAEGLEHRPYLPQLRSPELFKKEAEVIVFVKGGEKTLIREEFIEANVVRVYDEGCVEFVAKKKWHTGNFYEGRGGSCGIESPQILPKSEWEYFKRNPDYLRLWISLLKEPEESFVQHLSHIPKKKHSKNF